MPEPSQAAVEKVAAIFAEIWPDVSAIRGPSATAMGERAVATIEADLRAKVRQERDVELRERVKREIGRRKGHPITQAAIENAANAILEEGY